MSVARGHGRKSSARRPVATGAWSEDPKTVQPDREFVYYTDRQNWEEEAEIDTRRLQAGDENDQGCILSYHSEEIIRNIYIYIYICISLVFGCIWCLHTDVLNC